MTLKSKIEVFLNQKGDFRCPNPTHSAQAQKTKPATKPAASPKAPAKKPVTPKAADVFTKIVKTLKQQQAKSRPKDEKALTSTVASLLKQQKSSEPAAKVIAKLFDTGVCTLVDKTIVYAF